MTPTIFDIEAQKAAAARTLGNTSIATLHLAAEHLQVVDEETYQAAIDLRNRFGEAEKKILEFWEPLAKQANALHKSLTKARADMAKPYVDGKESMDRKARAYLKAQDDAKRELERRLADAARKEQIRLEREAADLADRGFLDKAEIVSQQAEMTVAPQLGSVVPKAAGAKVAEAYVGTVTDIYAVLKAIVTGKIPLMYEYRGTMRPLVTVDESVLNAIVSRQLDSTDIPGVRVEKDFRISRRGE